MLIFKTETPVLPNAGTLRSNPPRSMGKGAGRGGDGDMKAQTHAPRRLVPECAENGGPYQGPFPPLKEVRENLQVIWYRCPMRRGALGELMKRSDTQGLLQAGGHLALWLFTASLVYCCWLRGMVFAGVASMWLHGIVGSTFVYGCHELGHGTVFKTKALNTAFLNIFSVLFWWEPFDYAASHTYHHRYSQYPEGDRENLFPLEPSLDPWLMLELFTCNVTSGCGRVFGKGGLVSTVKLTVKAALGGVASEPDAEQYEWLNAVHADQPEEFRKSKQFSRVIVLFHAIVFAASIASGQWIFIPIVNFHAFVANWYSYFVGNTQHCGLRSSVNDFRKNTRSITLDPISEFLFWRMNWHIEHHMFAAVPCYNLKALHREVASDMPAPRSLVGAWKEMRLVWHKQQEDPAFEFDTAVPKPVEVGVRASGEALETVSDEIGSSIGDLAPEGLTQRRK